MREGTARPWGEPIPTGPGGRCAAGHRLTREHACAVHTQELIGRLGALAPVADAEDSPVQPDDIATSLAEQAGVRSVVHLDREVFAVNERTRHPASPGQRSPTDSRHDESTRTEGSPAGPTEPRAAGALEDDTAPRLVTGDARTRGRRLQVWVSHEGILVLPAGTIPR